MTTRKTERVDSPDKRRYHQTNGRWEQAIIRQIMPLGRLLMRTRDSGGAVRLEDPRIKPELTRVIGALAGWHRNYSRWRAVQGKPLHGRYRPPEDGEPPARKAAAAAKEVGYRLSLKEKAQARAALKDLAEAAEALARLEEKGQDTPRK